MNILEIVKTAAAAFDSVLKVAENFVPAGEFKNILEKVDEALQALIGGIPAAMKDERIKAASDAALKAACSEAECEAKGEDCQ